MRAVVLLGLALVLFTCSAAPDRDLTLAYGRAVRDIGLFPVYPPREEFQIGDVYMWSQSLSDPNDTVSVYLTSIEWLRGEADQFMKSRIVFANSGAGDDAATTRDIPGNRSGLVTRGDPRAGDLAQSLPIAAFPTVAADAGFTAGAGLVEALAAVGLAGGARTTVELNFNDVRTYWVPSVNVMGDIRDEIPKIMRFSQAGEIDRNRLGAARRGAGTAPCPGGRQCGISVVTRVYLTRQINYTYRNSRIIAAALRRAEVPGTEAPVAPAVNVSVSTTTDALVDSATLDRDVAELRKQVDALTASSARGQAFRFEGWDARGVTFSRSFQRPVVVGWDGVDLLER